MTELSNDQLEHLVLNQIEKDLEDQDYDAFSEMLQLLINIPEAKEILINYLPDDYETPIITRY